MILHISMAQSFKNWLKLDELKFGSDGMRDNQTTQTMNATTKVGQSWLGDPKNAESQNLLMQSKGNPSILSKELLTIGADAVKGARAVGKTTTAPMVANFVQGQLGLPNTIKLPKPGQVQMMRSK